MASVKAQFSLRVDIKLYAKLKKIAKNEMRSLNNMIELLLTGEIERYERSHGVIELSDDDLYSE